MPATLNGAQLTPLLDNGTLSRLERLRINTTRRFTDKRRGEHLTGRGGSSNEFSDYRDYVAGDDVRFVDWNIFARLHRPYLKLYHEEEVMHVVLLLDASSSMLHEGKLEMAKSLAAAFGVMGLFASERVSVCAFNSPDAAPAVLPPCNGRASMAKVFRFIEGLDGGGNAPAEQGIDLFLKQHIGRGVAVLLSDFLTFGDLKRAFNRLFSVGLEILAVQILGESEIDPAVVGDSRFIDCETAESLDVTCNADLLGLYHEYRLAHERQVALLCQQRSGRFLSVSAAESVPWLLLDLMLRRGWIR